MQGDESFLDLIGSETQGMRLKAGTVLFKKGDPADAMYVVRSGELQIYDSTAVYRTVHSGEVFGELALIEKSPRNVSVRALAESEVIAINERHFLRMVERTPYFALLMLRTTTRRLRQGGHRLQAVA